MYVKSYECIMNVSPMFTRVCLNVLQIYHQCVQKRAGKCPARHIMEENPDGSVLAVFKALHNHDCQQQYLLHYLNPLDICTTLSDIVDTKLLAGVTDLTNIHSSMLKEVKELREDNNFDSERTYHISLACDTQKITNRKKRLGIKNPFVTHGTDVRSVTNLVETWAREKGDNSMVLYFKREGVFNVL